MDTEPELITLEQAEARFGLKRSTLYRYVSAGRLSTYKRAGDRRSYVRVPDLEQLVKPTPRERKRSTQADG